MKLFWVMCFVVVFAGVGGDMLHFRKKLLDTFNYARSMIAAGQFNPLVDMLNEVGANLPKFGPAANMHRLKWSRHLEQHAYLHMEKTGFEFKHTLSSFPYKGLVGFTWAGNVLDLLDMLANFIPVPKIKDVLQLIVKVLDFLITCFLLLYNYPHDETLKEGQNLGATNALFAHRYEIGCYGKVFYTICMMDGSTNGNRFYERGIPCSNCTEYCEFHEDENGYIEEGNLCEAPKESVADLVATFSPPITTTLPMKTVKPKKSFWPTKLYISMPSIMFSFVILIVILLAHVFSK